MRAATTVRDRAPATSGTAVVYDGVKASVLEEDPVTLRVTELTRAHDGAFAYAVRRPQS